MFPEDSFRVNELGFNSDSKPLIAVTMATSRQGIGVVRHLSESNRFDIRAITRNTNSKASRYLKTLKNVNVVSGNLLNPESLEDCFHGAYGVFGNTSPTKPWGMDKKYEQMQGENLIKAVSSSYKNGFTKHFVFSSICKPKKNLNVENAPSHFATKWGLEELIKISGIAAFTTVLRPASYYENFEKTLPGINLKNNIFTGVVSPNNKWQTLAVDDIGLWTCSAFKNPQKLIGQALNLACEELTGNEMAQVFQIIGNGYMKNIEYKMIPRPIMKLIECDIATMATWIENEGYGADIIELKKLAIDLDIKMTSLKSWFKNKIRKHK